MNFWKVNLVASGILFSLVLSANAQEVDNHPAVSQAIDHCVSENGVSKVSIRDGKLVCDEAGTILWVRGFENQPGDSVTELPSGALSVDLSVINDQLGTLPDLSTLTVDVQKLEDPTLGLQGDQHSQGTDLWVESFLSIRTENVIRPDQPYSTVIPTKFVDNETLTCKDRGDSPYYLRGDAKKGFFSFVAFDYAQWDLALDGFSTIGTPQNQALLAGPSICSKNKYIPRTRIPAGTRTRAYTSGPGQYDYLNLGIDLPTSFKKNEDDLSFVLRRNYSQKSGDGAGREHDAVALWGPITRDQYDRAPRIILTAGETPGYPAVIISLVKQPVSF